MKVQFSIRKIGLFGKLGEDRKMGLDIVDFYMGYEQNIRLA